MGLASKWREGYLAYSTTARDPLGPASSDWISPKSDSTSLILAFFPSRVTEIHAEPKIREDFVTSEAISPQMRVFNGSLGLISQDFIVFSEF